MKWLAIVLPLAGLSMAGCGSEGVAGDVCTSDDDCGDALVCGEAVGDEDGVCEDEAAAGDTDAA